MKDFKPPKSLAACADALYSTREARLALNRQAELLEKQEAILRDHIIDNLPKSQATGVAGALARVTVVTKDVPTVSDWELLRAYITKNQKKNPGVWALMNRSVGVAGVKELWESGVEVPGVTKLQVKALSLNKV